MDEIREHTESDRAVWLINVIQYTSDELGSSVVEITSKLEGLGLIDWALKGYHLLHTQGFEYMADLMIEKIQER